MRRKLYSYRVSRGPFHHVIRGRHLMVLGAAVATAGGHDITKGSWSLTGATMVERQRGEDDEEDGLL